MAVVVRAPSRLHLGFIPPVKEGESPGSAAVAIERPFIEMVMTESEDIHVSGAYSALIFEMAADFLSGFAPGKGVDIDVRDAMKRHAGFGSGTRMAMSVGMGISGLYGLGLAPYDIAKFFGRGRNSVAGIETLIHGGMAIVHPGGEISRPRIPEGWSFIIALPASRHDFHGDEERKAMASMKKHITEDDLASMLDDAIRSADIEEAGRLLERIDLETGKMFSGAQEGDYSHRMVGDLIRAGKEAGAYGAGQSSWGPAVYFLVDDSVAERVKATLEDLMGEKGSVAISDIAPEGISLDLRTESG